MSKITIEKSTIPETKNVIEISTTFYTTIVNNNMEYDRVEKNE